MGDSIFEFADEFGVTSPFGKWVNEDFKHLTSNNPKIVNIFIGYSDKNPENINPKSTKKGAYIIISSKIEGEDKGFVSISCNGGALPSGNIQINNKKRDINGVLSYVVTREFYITVEKHAFQPKAFTAWVRITSGNQDFDNKEQKFTFNSDGQISEEGIEMKSDKRDCFCKKTNWSVEDLKYLVSQLRKSDVITPNGKAIRDKDGKITGWVAFTKYDDNTSDKKQIKDRLFYLKKDEKIDSDYANYEKFVKYFNSTCANYGINTCLRKIHFLAQAYHETERFASTYENTSGTIYSGGDFYQGRGLIQITHDYNYKALYQSFFEKTPTKSELEQFVPKVAKSLKYAVKSAGWYWKKNNVNKYADLDDVDRVSAAINRPSLLKNKVFNPDSINGLDSRRQLYILVKNILDEENCGK
jgi:predicted chitinase